MDRFESAKARYAAQGIDVDAAMARVAAAPVALHCWQGDDVKGFDGDPNAALTGGIQTTGNYPGIARNPEEVFADLDKALSLIPGTHKINVHANYAIGEPGETIENLNVQAPAVQENTAPAAPKAKLTDNADQPLYSKIEI